MPSRCRRGTHPRATDRGLEAFIRSNLSPQHRDQCVASRPDSRVAARTDALTLFGLMLGTLQLPRTLTDRDLSDQLLDPSVDTAMKLLVDRT